MESKSDATDLEARETLTDTQLPEGAEANAGREKPTPGAQIRHHDHVVNHEHLESIDQPDAASMKDQPSQAVQKANIGGSTVSNIPRGNPGLDLHDFFIRASLDDPDFHRVACPCCPARLVYRGPPAPGNPLDDISSPAPVIYADDARPTFDYESALTHHCSTHECMPCMLRYLSYPNPSLLANLAMSGPVLKHLPAFHALLQPADNGTFPDLGDACSISGYALALLKKPATRAKLHNTLEDVKKAYELPPAVTDNRDLDNRKRAKIVASLTLSLFGDLIEAEHLTVDEYNEMYMPYAAYIQKEGSPWDQGLFYVQLTHARLLRWPVWGPVQNVCRCGKMDCAAAEHDVEVYHRALTIMRWALKETASPAVYYHRTTGLGRAHRLRYEKAYIFASIRTILTKNRQEDQREKGTSPLSRIEILENIRKQYTTEGMVAILDTLQGPYRMNQLLAIGGTSTSLDFQTLISTSTKMHDKPFPSDGTRDEKETWVLDLEKEVWLMLEAVGINRTNSPILIPDIRWFARSRAKFDHNFQATITEEDLRELERYMDAGHGANLGPIEAEWTKKTDLNDMKVIVAMEKLKKTRIDFCHLPEDTTATEYEVWVDKKCGDIMGVYQLAGARETDRKRLLGVTAQLMFYSWFAVQSERSLKVGPEPDADDLATWGDQLAAVSASRTELHFYFRYALSKTVIDNMLDDLVQTCHPGDEFLNDSIPVPSHPRAKRLYFSRALAGN